MPQWYPGALHPYAMAGGQQFQYAGQQAADNAMEVRGEGGQQFQYAGQQSAENAMEVRGEGGQQRASWR